MIKKVARPAFLESGDKKKALMTVRRQAGAGAAGPGLLFCDCGDLIAGDAWTLVRRSALAGMDVTSIPPRAAQDRSAMRVL